LAAVNFGAGKLKIEAHALTDPDIIKAVQQAGYQALSDGQTIRPDFLLTGARGGLSCEH